jgi:hypothetical protein
MQGQELTGVTCCYVLGAAAMCYAEKYCHLVTTAAPTFALDSEYECQGVQQ